MYNKLDSSFITIIITTTWHPVVSVSFHVEDNGARVEYAYWLIFSTAQSSLITAQMSVTPHILGPGVLYPIFACPCMHDDS